jgi:hypothetical protein
MKQLVTFNPLVSSLARCQRKGRVDFLFLRLSRELG